eukprot:1161215-Pelagomonas_calceolata.AAC.13
MEATMPEHVVLCSAGVSAAAHTLISVFQRWCASPSAAHAAEHQCHSKYVGARDIARGTCRMPRP